MNNAPIGVFDSGVGGLTVLKALIAALPREHFVYLGDTARLPYGTKSPETVARYSLQAVEALARYGVKCLVIACNTASSVGLPAIRASIRDRPVIGVIEPGAQAACEASASGHIAVIATEGTVRGAAYQRAILQLRPLARVTAVPAPLFVALAEEGLNEGSIANDVATHYLAPLFSEVSDSAGSRGKVASNAENVLPDTLVLGCTHFPMLLRAIRAAVGTGVQIVDSAATTAASVEHQLRDSGLLREDSSSPPGVSAGRVRFLATDGAERFARIGGRFLERNITPDEVELVDL